MKDSSSRLRSLIVEVDYQASYDVGDYLQTSDKVVWRVYDILVRFESFYSYDHKTATWPPFKISPDGCALASTVDQPDILVGHVIYVIVVQHSTSPEYHPGAVDYLVQQGGDTDTEELDRFFVRVEYTGPIIRPDTKPFKNETHWSKKKDWRDYLNRFGDLEPPHVRPLLVF